MLGNLKARCTVQLFLSVLIATLVSATAWASPGVTLTGANDKTRPIVYGPVGPNFVPNIPPPTQSTTCDAAHPCDETPLTVSLPATLVNQQVTVVVEWPNHQADSDFDLYIRQGNTDIARDGSVFDPEIASFPAANGNYTIRVVIFNPEGQSFTVKVFYEPIPTPNPAPTGPSARFQTYPAPKTLSAAAAALEPSIGVNWATGSVATECDTHTLFTTFNDCSSPAIDTWVQHDASNNAIDFDPILFTDLWTNRTFNSLLITDPVGFSSGCSLSNHTDNDGGLWVPQDGCSHPGGSDHQTLGGGPYHAPLVGTPAYPNAVYYCAQDPGPIVADPILCARSDNGGVTFGPAVAAYTVECFGLHGHIKVGPDGTVYLPVRNCSANGFAGDGFAVSEDNGTTWSYSVVPGSKASASDPSIGIGLNNIGKPPAQKSNTTYLGYCDGNGHAMVGVSHNIGKTWVNVYDVGAPAGIQNCVFPDAVAGDDNRAMMYFLGTPVAGNFQDASFAGEWHAYVASTYDGGTTWGLVDVTPNQPVQIGCIWLQGGSNPCRNLLDFNDATLDKQGRLTAVFAGGCVAPGCVAGSPGNASRSRFDTIVRQSGGKRLFAANDPAEPARPGAPRLESAVRGANGVTVKWSAPDNGGLPITGYNIYRGTAPSTEGLLTTVGPNKPEFIDTSATTGTPYYYQVTAVNAQGESARCQEIAISGQAAARTICVLPGVQVVSDPAGDQTGAPANGGLDITELAIAEPFTTNSDKSLTFTIKVSNLGTPQSQSKWYALFNAKDTNGVDRQFFVSYDTTATTPGFSYGYVDKTTTNGNTFTSQTPAKVTGAADSTKSQIVMRLDTSSPLMFGPPTGATTTAFTASFGAGTVLTAVQSRTTAVIGVLLQTIDTTDATATYTVRGNASCAPNNPPLPVLLADKTNGVFPLTVNFDASSSSDPDAGDSIVTYTFDFGDGSAPASQATPTISHTYGTAGNFTARLTVTDSHNQVSPGFSSVNITVTGPPGMLQFSSATYSVSEGGGMATITVTRVGGSGAAVSVSYATSNGTATGGSDYTPTSGTLNWAAGDATSKSFTIPIIDDSIVEGDETVGLALTNATGGASLGAPTSAVLTIVDNDTSPTGPTVGSTAPGAECQGSAVTLTVNGTNFVSGSVVQVGGAARPTTFVNAGQLKATLTSNDVGSPITVRVVNPGGGTSNAVTVTVPLLGDLNLDRRVDAVDLNIMSNYLVGNVSAGTAPFTAPASAADLNSDSSVNAIDLVVLSNYLVGNIQCLPAP